MKRILAINPWAADFAAYDFWLKPYGFLQILTYLKQKTNARINFIDCMLHKNSNIYGQGKFYSRPIEKPKPLRNIPRRYKLYGITLKEFEKKLRLLNGYDCILITSSMTYWYKGLEYTLKALNANKISAPVFLGGTYINLCKRHAEENFPQARIFNSFQIEKLFQNIGVSFNKLDFKNTLPDYTLFYKKQPYIVLKTSYGCPFNCAYCGIKQIEKGFFQIPERLIVDYIYFYYQRGIRNFVFYDDALFYKNWHIKNILKRILSKGIKANFHTPNGLHINFIDLELAKLLKRTHFINPYLSIETLSEELQVKWQNKYSRQAPFKAIEYLRKAGFEKGEYTAYLLFAYPNQDFEKLKKDALILNQLGAKVSLSEFSPVPKTAIFKILEKSAFYNLSNPLCQNNSIFPFYPLEKWEELFALKNFVRELNRKFN